MPAPQLSELQQAARRQSERSAKRLQEDVDWDLNARGMQERLAPLVFEVGGARLEIAQSSGALNEPGQAEKGTGGVVWTATVGLARYLEHRYGAELTGKRVLELGCGTGLVSLASAALGAAATATDIPACVAEVTARSLAANRGALRGTVEARELTWGSTPLEPSFGAGCGWWDLVVASEVIYRAEHVPLLLATLRGVVGPGRTALVAFDRRGREGVDAFLRAVRAPDGAGFGAREVNNAEEMPEGYRFVHFGLVELTRAE